MRNLSHHYLFGLLSFLAFCIAPSIVGAQSPALYPITGSPRTDGGMVVGVSMNSHGQTIGGLGFYDSGDGLSDNYLVGLWDSSQNLIASATVTPSSPLIGDCRYELITPITFGTLLIPETFTVGVLLPSVMNDIWLDQAMTVLASGFTGGATGQFETTGTLQYPSNFDTGSYYAANALVVAPEPSILTLAALTSIALLRRRA